MSREPSQHDKLDQAQKQKPRKSPLFEIQQDDDNRHWSTGRLFGQPDERPSPPAAPPRRARPKNQPTARRAAPSEKPARARSTTGSAAAARRSRSTTRSREDVFMARRRHDYEEVEADPYLIDRLQARPYPSGSARTRRLSSGSIAGPGQTFLNSPVHLIVIAIISLIIIRLLWPGTQGTILSGWVRPAVSQVTDTLGLPNPFAPPPHPPGDYRLRGTPSISADQIDSILVSYGSPAAGTGQAWVDLGRKYNIDPVFALAFFVHESTAGTNANWAGIKSDGTTTHNVGNIICAGYARCYGRFRDYGSWEEGIEDWYRLIDGEYIQGRGTETVADVVPIYAPAFENDVQRYVSTVEQLVDTWRGSSSEGFSSGERPSGNPLHDARTIMTQGYGIGSHAPANVWGAVDLALDSNGDGSADPEGTWDKPIYATHSGVTRVSPDSVPAGNHIWIINEDYKTGYAHLSRFAVSDGQPVARGTLIGYIGSTGQSSGPHLDYQVWRKEGALWINENPLDYGVLDEHN